MRLDRGTMAEAPLPHTRPSTSRSEASEGQGGGHAPGNGASVLCVVRSAREAVPGSIPRAISFDVETEGPVGREVPRYKWRNGRVVEPKNATSCSRQARLRPPITVGYCTSLQPGAPPHLEAHLTLCAWACKRGTNGGGWTLK